MRVGFTHPEGVDIVPDVPERLRVILEASPLARQRDLSVDVEPMLLVFRYQRPHGGAYRILESGLASEGRIDLLKDIIHRLLVIVEDHLDDAEAGIDRLEEVAIALGAATQLFQPGARFILSPPAPQRGLGQADQRRRVEGTFQEGDVAERIEIPPRRRISLEAAALLGQQHEREVRPFGLGLQPFGQRMEIGRSEPFLGQQRKARTRGETAHQRRQRFTNLGSDTRLSQDGGSDRRIPADRRQDQRALGQMRYHVMLSCCSPGVRPIKFGTPRKMPWKLVSGSPSLMPSAPIQYSRIVSS